MEKKEFSAMSSDGKHLLKGVVYVPEGRPKGLIQVIHGMAEHIGRYDYFMTKCCEDGWLVFGYDNLGHGRTAIGDAELGFIAKKDGWKYLVKDVQIFKEAVVKEYGISHPYVLIGHSMGSFIARHSAVSNPRPDKLILLGTGGPQSGAGAAAALARTLSAVKGPERNSKMLEKIMFKGYNDRFKDEPDADEYSWLSNDKNVRIRYMTDRFCGHRFSVSALGDLLKLVENTGKKQCIDATCKTMPIFLASGENDPVGDYGEGVARVARMFHDSGAKMRLKLYPGMRHEILNDSSRDEVIRDILEFCDK